MCFIVESDEYEIGTLNNAVGAVGTQAEVHFGDVGLSEDRALGSVDELPRTASGKVHKVELE